MSHSATIPTHDEIREQLARVLDSPRLRNAPNQKDFLELVVKRALEGKKTPGHVVAKAMFGGKFIKRYSTDVRVTAANLRKNLDKYTSEHGAEDLVVIALPDPPVDKTIKVPEGDAYTPKFSYNPLQPASNDFKLGRHFRMHAMIGDDQRAMRHFGATLRRIPNHLEAAIGAFEAFFDLFEWGLQSWEIEQEFRDILVISCELMGRAIDQDSKFWRVWAALGSDFRRVSQNENARLRYARALHLDRGRTESYEPFLEFLTTVGYEEEAVRLARSHYLRHVEDINACLMYCRILVRAKQFPEAARMAEEALQLDKGNCEANRLIIGHRIAKKRYDDALFHFQLAKALSDTPTFIRICVGLMRSVPVLPESIKCQLVLPEPNSQTLMIENSAGPSQP